MDQAPQPTPVATSTPQMSTNQPRIPQKHRQTGEHGVESAWGVGVLPVVIVVFAETKRKMEAQEGLKKVALNDNALEGKR